MRYVSLVNNGIPNPNDLIKISKKMYKVGIIVTVRKDDLRKELENAGFSKIEVDQNQKDWLCLVCKKDD